MNQAKTVKDLHDNTTNIALWSWRDLFFYAKPTNWIKQCFEVNDHVFAYLISAPAKQLIRP